MDILQKLRSLEDRYSIERQIGSGGMATVYLARDVKHGREVAIKVLRADLSAVIGTERFLAEIRIAASLDHPHILTLIDSGSADGLLYYVLPYVRGESLRAKLEREKQLGVQDAISITTQVASALDYAHAQGVVHRDIKPENILLHEGEAVLADFGIALAIEEAGGDRLTETGQSLGTPKYMSPEQAMGDRSLDRRSDVYSLGAVFYEMIAGEPPVTGPSAQAIIAKLLTEKPVKLHVLRDTIPLAMERATEKALAKTRADRFDSAGEFARALSAAGREPERSVRGSRIMWAAIGVAAAAVIAIGLWVAIGKSNRSPHTAATRESTVSETAVRLAVLPFENLGRAEDSYVADGITDEVRGKLSLLPALRVIARSSSVHYRGTPKLPSEIARELGVRYLLTGTVRWERATGGKTGRVRVSPELVEITDGMTPVTKWQQSFDAALTDIFEVQSNVASRVAEALDLRLGAGERARLAVQPTANLGAYDAYLQGEQVSNGLAGTDPVTLGRAIRFYERAVGLDSAFAQAWGRLASARVLLHHYGPGGADRVKLAANARAAAERALSLAPDHPEGWAAMSAYYQLVEFDLSRAAEQVARGLQVSPNDATLLGSSGFIGESLGRWEQALADYRRAATLDPLSPAAADKFGASLLWRRQYPEAQAVLDHALVLAPDNLGIREHRAMVDLARGDLAAARRIITDAPRGVDRAALAAYFATYWDLSWVLDDTGQRLLLTLTPEAFGDDQAWSLALADVAALRGDARHLYIYADSTRAVVDATLPATPNDVQLLVARGVALAHLGRANEAVRAGQRAVALMPVANDAWHGAYLQHQLARIYIMVGEPEKALDQLEPLLKMPYFLSPAWLRIDPTFARLRGNPRFERLTGGK